MSHVSTYKHKIKDVKAFLNVAKSLGYDCEYNADGLAVRQFGRNVASGILSVIIPGWKYGIAITADGAILYDHWGSQPNTIEKLGELIQTYNVNVAMQQVPYTELENFYSTKQADGNIKLVLEYA